MLAFTYTQINEKCGLPTQSTWNIGENCYQKVSQRAQANNLLNWARHNPPISSTYSCCIVSIVTFEKWEQELRSNCKACREAISFSYSSEKLFRAVTKDSLTRCFKLSGSALPRGVKEWIRYKMKLNLKSRFLVITAFRSLSSLLLMCS